MSSKPWSDCAGMCSVGILKSDSAEEPLWSKSDSEKDHLRCIPRQFKSRTDEASAYEFSTVFMHLHSSSKTGGSSAESGLILLKNPSGQKVAVKKTISDVSPGNSNRVQTKLARMNSRQFSCIFTHLQKRGVRQQNQD